MSLESRALLRIYSGMGGFISAGIVDDCKSSINASKYFHGWIECKIKTKKKNSNNNKSENERKAKTQEDVFEKYRLMYLCVYDTFFEFISFRNDKKEYGKTVC